jgi:uncharacterized protein YndB with AHSA1/START domain
MAAAATRETSAARRASTQHATFVIERSFAASPAQVFAAWAGEQAKSRWFAGSEAWKEDCRSFDFRVGGREHLRGTWRDGHVSDFDAHYHDIVPNQRIVYSYGMHIDDARISVSLSTVEFKAADAGTRMIYTEQAVFLDGYDDAGSRERGTRSLFDNLDRALAARA